MTDLYLGLISGTSADAIDVALVAFEPALALVERASHAYPRELRARILELSQASALVSLDEAAELDVRIGHVFSDAASALLDRLPADVRARIRAIGTHGQTLRHRPIGAFPYTLQLGDPNVIAERTGVTVVADFRRRDVAAGGQGAPLMPAFHAAVLSSPDEPRAVLNLGGIANLTLLGEIVRGFDTGPANGLMDAWIAKHRGLAHDADGAWAASGRADESVVERWLAHPYFAKPAPKSTGRDEFHLGAMEIDARAKPEDMQASLALLTARSIAQALKREMPGARRLIACGGGVHNAHVMRLIAEELDGVTVDSSDAHGLDPDHVEAMGFAWLAKQTLEGKPGNLPSVTGARGARILGAIYPG